MSVVAHFGVLLTTLLIPLLLPVAPAFVRQGRGGAVAGRAAPAGRPERGHRAPNRHNALCDSFETQGQLLI